MLKWKDLRYFLAIFPTILQYTILQYFHLDTSSHWPQYKILVTDKMNVSNGSKIRVTDKIISPFSKERRLLKGLYTLLLVKHRETFKVWNPEDFGQSLKEYNKTKPSQGNRKCKSIEEKEIKYRFQWPLHPQLPCPASLPSTMGSVRSWLVLTVNSQWGWCFLSMQKELRHFLLFKQGPFFFQRTGKATRDSHSASNKPSPSVLGT